MQLEKLTPGSWLPAKPNTEHVTLDIGVVEERLSSSKAQSKEPESYCFPSQAPQGLGARSVGYRPLEFLISLPWKSTEGPLAPQRWLGFMLGHEGDSMMGRGSARGLCRTDEHRAGDWAGGIWWGGTVVPLVICAPCGGLCHCC